MFRSGDRSDTNHDVYLRPVCMIVVVVNPQARMVTTVKLRCA